MWTRVGGRRGDGGEERGGKRGCSRERVGEGVVGSKVKRVHAWPFPGRRVWSTPYIHDRRHYAYNEQTGEKHGGVFRGGEARGRRGRLACLMDLCMRLPHLIVVLSIKEHGSPPLPACCERSNGSTPLSPSLIAMYSQYRASNSDHCTCL